MKKCLLLDDRDSRQSIFLTAVQSDFSHYSTVLENKKGEQECQNILDAFLNNKSVLDSYHTIMMHKSIYSSKTSIIVNTIKEYCEMLGKELILFSGGIDTVFYSDKLYKHMELNSKQFYSENLLLYLDNRLSGLDNILVIGFGNKWKLNITLNILEKIGIFIQKSDKSDIDILYEDFKLQTEIQVLDNIVSYEQPFIENGWCDLDTIKILYQTIKKEISVMVDEYE